MDTPQFDPALKQLLLEFTGHPLGEGASPEAAAQEIPVLARLGDPGAPVPGLRTVTTASNIITGRVRVGDVVAVRSHENVLSLKASTRVYPSLAVSVPEIRASREVLRREDLADVTGRGVIIGMLDWGLDVAHANFRNADGSSRVIAIWDQQGGRSPTSPRPFGYGRALTRAEIDRALQSENPYAALRYDPLDADIVGPRGDYEGAHGTHTTDIAAGNGRASGSAPGVAPEADIIFVDLRSDDTDPETQSLGDSVRVLEAAHYVVMKAGGRPVVLNVSLGSMGGSHDAAPLVVQGLDALAYDRAGCAVVMSSGNYGNARMHTSGRLTTGGETTLNFVVPAKIKRPAEIEVWYEGVDEFIAELLDPTGSVVLQVEAGQDAVAGPPGARVASGFHRLEDSNTGDNQINMFVWPSAPEGEWRLRIRAKTVRNGLFHAYIERSGAQQTRFVSGTEDSSHNTGSICNGQATIAVSAYDPRDPGLAIAQFSSIGLSRDNRAIPVISAPGVNIVAARSSSPPLEGGPRRRDQTIPMSGTSMAAPHVTGVVALMLEAAGAQMPTVTEIRRCLIKTARINPPSTLAERRRYGAGRVDAAAAVAAIRHRGRTAEMESDEPSADEMPTSDSLSIHADITPSNDMFAAAEIEPEPAPPVPVQAMRTAIRPKTLLQPRAYSQGRVGWPSAATPLETESILTAKHAPYDPLGWMRENAPLLIESTFAPPAGLLARQETSGVSCRPFTALAEWRDLIRFRPSPAVERSLQKPWAIDYRMQRIEDGWGDVNLDFYPIRITTLPILSGRLLTPEELLTYIRLNLNDFVDRSISEFAPYDAAEAVKWRSPSPLTAVIHIDMKVAGGNIEDGSVLCADARPESWTFSTIWTPDDLAHPLNGNRQFGFRRVEQGRDIIIFTRAADRVSSLADKVFATQAWAQAHALWTSFQNHVSAFVNGHGGRAAIESATSCRYNWTSVRTTYYPPVRSETVLRTRGGEVRHAAETTETSGLDIVALGLSIWETGKSIFTSGAFETDTTPATYRHPNTPLDTPAKRYDGEFSIYADHPRPVFGPQVFWFKISFIYNGYDVRDATITPLVAKSSSLSISTFSIKFVPNPLSAENELMCRIRFTIGGRWNPFGLGDYSFWGRLDLSADGSISLLVEGEKEGNSQVFWPGKFANSQLTKLKVPTRQTTSCEVFFSPPGSFALSDAAIRQIKAWFDGIPPAVKREVQAGRIPIIVKGFASTTGTVAKNQQIARQRAEAVQVALRDVGGSGLSIQTFTFGELTAGTPDETEDPKRRRASAEVIYFVD